MHTELLHKLGNLGLLSGAYNAVASNRPFTRKRTTYDDSSCKLLEEVAKLSEWTPQELLKRHDQLVRTLAARCKLVKFLGLHGTWQLMKRT